MSMAIISAVLVAGSTAYGLAESGNQKRRGRHQQEALDRERAIQDARDVLPKELEQNRQLASLRSKTGLPTEQYAMAQKAIQRQQARTLKSASDRRMGLGLLASIDDNANKAQGNLDVANAQARLNNERNLMGINKDVASWKIAKVNRDLSQWNQKMDYAKAVEGSGRQNQANAIMSGINAAGLIAGAAYKNSNNSSWANGLFGNNHNKADNSYRNTERIYDANGEVIHQ